MLQENLLVPEKKNKKAANVILSKEVTFAALLKIYFSVQLRSVIQ